MPKIYFAKKQLGSVTGATVHVRYSYAAVFQGGVDKKLSEAVNEGLAALELTVNYMKDTDSNNLNAHFKRYFEKYFLSQNYTDADMLNTIYAVLLLTKNGLANSNTIKVYSKQGTSSGGIAAGYVNNYWGKTAAQKHRNPGTYQDPNGEKAVFKGDIHMGSSIIKNNSQLNNVVLFIHEATHKYASTSDFGEKGYTTANGSYRQHGLTTAEALNNADSYARFAAHFYRAQKDLKQW